MIHKLKYILSGIIIGALLSGTVAYAAGTQITVHFLPLKFFFDGFERLAPEDQQGFIYNGTTYVPLRFVSEALGKKVGYQAKTQSIYVGKQPEGSFTYMSKMKTHTVSSSYLPGAVEKLDSYFETNTGEKYLNTYLVGYWEKYDRYYRYEGKTFEYLLNGQYKKFEALLAPEARYSKDSKQNDIGYLKVYGDNDELLYYSGPVASDITTPVKVEVDLTGVLRAKIEVKGKVMGLIEAKFVE
jgi:hypothetical protein